MSEKPIRVLIADDHTLVRESLVSVLEGSGVCEVIAQAADGIEAVEKAVATRPDVAVVDISMPRLNGVEVVRRLHEALPDTKVLVLTMHYEEEYVLQLVRAGAAGYLGKDSATSELISAVTSLSEGSGYFSPQAAKIVAESVQRPERRVDDPYGNLTAREREVFHLMIEGLSTKLIARKLDISVKTAENHRVRVLRKLSVRNAAELVRYAVRRGLLD